MIVLAARFVLFLPLIFILGCPAAASTVVNIPPGGQPLPIYAGSRCDPVDDEGRFRGFTAPDFVHGTACLNEGRYADAIPYLERATKVDANPRTLVALGVAYDGVGRFHDASDRWRQARRLWNARVPNQHLDFRHPLGLEAALFEGRYAQVLIKLEQYFTPLDSRDRCCAAAPYNTPVFQGARLIEPFADALHVAAQGNPQRGAELIAALYSKAPLYGELRYPRAIMFLALGRGDEARFELRIASRMNTIAPHDLGPYPFQWSGLAILEYLAAPSPR